MKGLLDQDRKMVQESLVIPGPWARSPLPRVNYPDFSKEIETQMSHRNLKEHFLELISKIVVQLQIIIKPSHMATDKNSSENSIVEIRDTMLTSQRVKWASSPAREQDRMASPIQLLARLMRTKENFPKPIKMKNKLIRKIHLKAKMFSWGTRVNSTKNHKSIMMLKRTGSPSTF